MSRFEESNIENYCCLCHKWTKSTAALYIHFNGKSHLCRHNAQLGYPEYPTPLKCIDINTILPYYTFTTKLNN